MINAQDRFGIDHRTGRISPLLVVVLAAVAVAAGYYWLVRDVPEAVEPAPVVESPQPPRHPVPEPAQPEPDPVVFAERFEEELPVEPAIPLERSDSIVLAELVELAASESVLNLLEGTDLVSRLVATVDSLDGKDLSERIRPVVNVPGLPQVVETEQSLVLDPDNAARYHNHVQGLMAVDPGQAAQFYLENYSWFQQAYEDLGYPQSYFNDRLVEVIDHLLAVRLPEQPPDLVRPEVLYEFEDAELEQQSWGRKALIRMGPENAGRVREWLLRFRTEIATGG